MEHNEELKQTAIKLAKKHKGEDSLKVDQYALDNWQNFIYLAMAELKETSLG